MTALVGPNGSGKSTLLKGLTGILSPLGGRIERGSLKTSQIAYLPQQAEIDRSFPITVLDTVGLGLWHQVGMFGGMKTGHWQQARQALASVGLEGFEQRIIGNLSAGQFQRVLFARLLLQDCPVILLDEPFTAIDTRTTADLLDVIRRWHTENRTIIAVLHNFDQVRSHFPRTLMIAREPIGWGETAAVLTPENLQRARQMSEAWDESAEVCRHQRDMSQLANLFLAPFQDFLFMRHALVACLALALGCRARGSAAGPPAHEPGGRRPFPCGAPGPPPWASWFPAYRSMP